MAEWQTIDSAPRDGSWVLLIGGQTNEDFYMLDEGPECIYRPVVGMWEIGQNWLGVTGGEWVIDYWDGDWRSNYDSPTHWMPLPVPPAQED